MWVFKVIYDQTDGSVKRFKARLVARGDSQEEGVDYDLTYAPTASFTSFRLLIALAAHYDLELEHADISTAFLNSTADRTIYMRQPPGFATKGQEHKVRKLLKSLYGLKQASRLWHLTFHEFLVECGLSQLHTDHCLYVLKLDNGKLFFVLVYVDDLVVATNLPVPDPIVIFEDNNGCISYGTRSVNTSTMKHIDVKYHFLREEIAKGTVDLRRVSTSENVADIPLRFI
ncbi:Reverse transcriptase Ty1/copia-type domain-containing protein [Plasmodiophora brassicae]